MVRAGWVGGKGGARTGQKGRAGRGKREGNGEWDDIDMAIDIDIDIVIDIIQPTQALGFQDDCNLNIQSNIKVTSYMLRLFFFVPLFCVALHCARCA